MLAKVFHRPFLFSPLSRHQKQAKQREKATGKRKVKKEDATSSPTKRLPESGKGGNGKRKDLPLGKNNGVSHKKKNPSPEEDDLEEDEVEKEIGEEEMEEDEPVLKNAEADAEHGDNEDVNEEGDAGDAMEVDNEANDHIREQGAEGHGHESEVGDDAEDLNDAMDVDQSGTGDGENGEQKEDVKEALLIKETKEEEQVEGEEERKNRLAAEKLAKDEALTPRRSSRGARPREFFSVTHEKRGTNCLSH